MSMDRMETTPAEQPSQNGGGTTPLLELRDVNKQYGLNRVLNNVCFYVGKAEIMALLGDNGAGKSTTVKTISGVVPPDSGTLLWRFVVMARGQVVFQATQKETSVEELTEHVSRG